METMIIGIAGGTGSGKTTLTLWLKEHFGEDVSILYHDNYYKQHDDMPYEERCRLNYDHPDAFDTELLIADLQALRRGEAVHSPTYDYTVHNRAAETVEVRPARVILVEGILIFVDPALRELMDIKLFVDTDADVRILRRIMRDVKKRGPAARRIRSPAGAAQAPRREVCRTRPAVRCHSPSARRPTPCDAVGGSIRSSAPLRSHPPPPPAAPRPAPAQGLLSQSPALPVPSCFSPVPPVCTKSSYNYYTAAGFI